ncbi:MAG: cell division protein FtsZ [Candidatus Pacebacteria bacterium]|nr:cell division protein FtsZ [Candidatus Paceibacterota bacterium]
MTKIKVVGIGGSGSNAINRMMKCGVMGVEFIAINTDLQNLKKNNADKKIRIGKNITKGLGAGMNPNIGENAAKESREEIEEVLVGADIVFIACGLGGGTGTGGAPVVAKISKDLGILTIAIVTTPFSFEGKSRMSIAKKGEKALKKEVDTLISVSNNRLSLLIKDNTSIDSAFWLCDEVLRQAVCGISDLITLPGIINIDFADIKSILKDSGLAVFGIGIASGEDRAKEAVSSALSSPLLDISLNRTKGVLFNVSGGDDISLIEIDDIAKEIKAKVSPDAKILFGAVQSEDLKKNEIKVTVLITGL